MFDTHTHLTDKAFDKDRNRMIERAKEKRVKHILCCGWDIHSSRECIELSKDYEGIYAAVGIHPHEADRDWNLKEIEELILKNRVVAIGEIGLDFYKRYAGEENQLRLFREQVRMAKRFKLPMSIHIREAHKMALRILKEEEYFNGALHCFSGKEEDMEEALSLGLYISFAGPITYGSKRLEGLVRKTPLNRLLIETDSPLLPPHPKKGERNEPAYLTYIADKVSEIKGIDIREITQKNGENCFGI